MDINSGYNFICGPGFQVAQLFLNSIFEKYINWNNLIENNDNYKNNFQVILQKEFKTTPSYIILNFTDEDNETTNNYKNINLLQINQTLILNNYEMGVYLIVGHSNVNYNEINTALIYGKDIKSFHQIHEYINTNDKIILFFSKGIHKIKKKAEQIACENALKLIEKQIN